MNRIKNIGKILWNGFYFVGGVYMAHLSYSIWQTAGSYQPVALWDGGFAIGAAQYAGFAFLISCLMAYVSIKNVYKLTVKGDEGNEETEATS